MLFRLSPSPSHPREGITAGVGIESMKLDFLLDFGGSIYRHDQFEKYVRYKREQNIQFDFVFMYVVASRMDASANDKSVPNLMSYGFSTMGYKIHVP